MSQPKADRKGLCASAAWWVLFSGLTISPAALAQTTDEPLTADPDDQRIVVTGSRIPRPDYSSSTPVTSIGRELIQLSGATNLTDFLQDYPALVGSFDTASASGDSGFIGSTGLNLLNLRNLGTQRTLVLVNSRRHVAAVPGAADIDANAIPIDLIERVDVQTGGASAIYGADGVSGVVNFIMRDHFEGLRVRGQYGEPENGGAERGFMSATAGLNFHDGRGNIAIALEGAHEGRLSSSDRAHTLRGARLVRNPNDFTDDPSTPEYDPVVDDPDLFDRVPLDDLRWFQSGAGGAVDTNFDGVADFDGGTDQPWDNGAFARPDGIESRTFQQGGSGTPIAGYGRDLLGETERFALNVFGHYNLTDDVRFITEQKFVLTEALSFGQPTFDTLLFLSPDNPFIPPNIADAAADSLLLMSRDHFEFGFRGEDVSRETYRGVWGVESSLADWLLFNASYVYGEVDVRTIALNNRFNDRFSAAIDVVDADPGPGVNPQCRSSVDPNAPSSDPNTTLRYEFLGVNNLPMPTSFAPGPGSGCAPLNLFGAGSPSPEAIAWVLTDSTRSDENTQEVATAYVIGRAPAFRLQGGDIKYVLGGEWRRETSESIPALEDQAGLTFNTRIQPSRGSYEVREAFGEFAAPIFADVPFFAELTLNGAVRLSDYSTFGSTTTWNYGAFWSPVPDVTFRATKAEAVRVPNIAELYSTNSQTFAFIDDPCDASRLADGTSYRAANCAALLAGLGVANPATYVDQSGGIGINGWTGGNRNLNAETAETTTFGMIVRPRFVGDLTISLDYYDIDLIDAITTLDPQALANQCVDMPSLDNPFCGLVMRRSNGGAAGAIFNFLTRPVNVSEFSTKGADFSVSYFFDPSSNGANRDIGAFTFNLVGNYLGELEFVDVPGAAANPAEGEAGAPEWQVNFDLTWRKGSFLVNYGYNFFSETGRFDNVLREAQPDDLIDPRFLEYDARSTHDVQARWELSDSFAIYGGVNNLFGQEPDDFAESYPVSAVGRYFYLGFTTNTESLTGRR